MLHDKKNTTIQGKTGVATSSAYLQAVRKLIFRMHRNVTSNKASGKIPQSVTAVTSNPKPEISYENTLLKIRKKAKIMFTDVTKLSVASSLIKQELQLSIISFLYIKIYSTGNK